MLALFWVVEKTFHFSSLKTMLAMGFIINALFQEVLFLVFQEALSWINVAFCQMLFLPLLRRMHILLLDKAFYKCQLGQVD